MAIKDTLISLNLTGHFYNIDWRIIVLFVANKPQMNRKNPSPASVFSVLRLSHLLFYFY